jgi:hypothetical protein
LYYRQRIKSWLATPCKGPIRKFKKVYAVHLLGLKEAQMILVASQFSVHG